MKIEMTDWRDDVGFFASIAALVVGVIACTGAWVTHIVWGIMGLSHSTTTWQEAVMFALGVLLPPIGVIHGVLLWLGAVPW